MINQIKTALLLGALTGLLLVIGWLIGGASGLTTGFIFALLMNFGVYFFSDKLVLFMYRAKEAKKTEHANLHKLVEEVCEEAKLPKPKVYIIPTDNPNAFATGRNPRHAAVAVTNGILNLLSEKELKGVLAHEVAHVKNRDILISTIAATIAGVISYVAFMARWQAFAGDRDKGGNLAGLVLLGILAPLAAMIIQLAISRSREYLADETGAKLIKTGLPLASALEKLEASTKHNPLKFGSEATSHLFIVNPFSGGSLFKLFSTHPPVPERVRRLKSLKI